MKTQKTIQIYDGKNFCPECDQCPIVEHLPEEGMVIIKDPAKPENGEFKMTVKEYNLLINNAPKI
jgi:hypothetical protein